MKMPPSWSASDTDEALLLGSVLRSPQTLPEVVQLVTMNDFRRTDYKLVWSACVDLFARGERSDPANVAELLQHRGHVEEIGGYVALVDLLDTACTAGAARRHAERIRSAALLRDLATLGRQITADAEDPPASASEVLEMAERGIFALVDRGQGGQVVSLGEAVREACERIVARFVPGGPQMGVATGFRDLDALLAHLRPGELIVIAARPSVGKTALATCLALNAAKAGTPVHFASLEQSSSELAERALCVESRLDGQRLRLAHSQDDELDRLYVARDTLEPVPVYIDDAAGQGVLAILAQARRLVARHGVGLVVVDYLQLVAPENPKSPRQEQVALVSRRLKWLARELKVPVVALAQLNRQVEDRAGGRPKLADLRESGGIEADADVVILLHRPDSEHGKDVQAIDLLVAKQRNGPVGDVTLAYRRSCLRFEDYNPHNQQSPFDGASDEIPA